MTKEKTTNLATNLCHAEANFWRRLTRRHGKKSRGKFWKMLLELGLSQMDVAGARELRAIREHYRRYGSVALLVFFLVGLANHDLLRVARRSVRARETVQQEAMA